MYLGNEHDQATNQHYDGVRAWSSRNGQTVVKGSLRFTNYPNFERVTRYNKIVHDHQHPTVVKNSIFVGQVPNLLPLQYLAWILDTITGEYGTRWVLQTTKNGCAKAWMRDDIAQHKVIRMNRRVLFDVTGYWFAADDDAADDLRRYVDSLGGPGTPSQDPRLPRGLMVLEVIKSHAGK